MYFETYSTTREQNLCGKAIGQSNDKRGEKGEKEKYASVGFILPLSFFKMDNYTTISFINLTEYLSVLKGFRY